jgi:hypothetical protein
MLIFLTIKKLDINSIFFRGIEFALGDYKFYGDIEFSLYERLMSIN